MNRSCLVAVLFLMGNLPLVGAAQVFPVFPVGLLGFVNDTPTGHVLVEGMWVKPEDVAQTNQQSRLLRHYRIIRARTPDTLIGQTELARWCHQNNLIDRRDAHLKRALLHDPENTRVREFLGHVRINGNWIASEQIQSEQTRMASDYRRLENWRQPINAILKLLNSRSKIRQQGWQRLDEIDDPNAIVALEIMLASERQKIAHQALEVINRFDEREASESLLRIAFSNKATKLRDRAIELLAGRNPYDFVPALLSQLVTPVSGRYSITPDRRGNVLYRYELFQQNMELDTLVQFDRAMMQSPLTADRQIQRALMSNANRRAATASAALEQLNRSIRVKNRAIQNVLQQTLSVSPGNSPEDWWRWWYDENEIYTSVRPVSYTRYSDDDEVTSIPRPVGGRGECLVEGTLIWTDLGPVAVDELRVGDRVLCRDPQSWRLGYQSVLQPTQRPPTPTFRIGLDGETIQASGGHFFWVPDRGWTKTRDLNPGLAITTADGTAVEIQAIAPGETVQLYNIVVDRSSNYFVGQHRILSHDSTIPDRGGRSIDGK